MAITFIEPLPDELLVISRALDDIEEYGYPEDQNMFDWFKKLMDKHETEMLMNELDELRGDYIDEELIIDFDEIKVIEKE